ncbi:hypothetical protein FSY75_25250 [Streptomyces sp. TR1341]|uniref:hypothetical protein n=1 Tax=Streptomyces TaxID=1883 RepID=UPI00138ADD30|nr:hypothetical protein [Streptomyces murinus]NDK27700.1 hypothetical protein [Streptomyces sp. TR1341]
MVRQRERRTRRQWAKATVLCGVITAGLYCLAVYLGLSAVGHLGLIGRSRTMRVAYCDADSPATTSRGGTSSSGLHCVGYVDGRRVRVTGFSSPPRIDLPVEISRTPWGSLVPVDQGFSHKTFRVLTPLVPLAIAVMFTRWTRMSYRGWRNSSRLPTGSCE